MDSMLISPTGMSASPRMSANSPVQEKTNGRKRKRKSGHSPDTVASEDGGEEADERSKPPAKRACNECRQQKLRCDVKTEPFTQCARCNRLNLNCRIDANFKRVGKRSKHAEMEREIVELRRQLAIQCPDVVYGQINSAHLHVTTALDQGAAGSLLDLRNSHDANVAFQIEDSSKCMVLGTTILEKEQIIPLFDRFWLHYHPFLPLLDPSRSPEFYYELSPLLFWVVVAIAARRYEADTTLLTGLAPSLSDLVWSTVKGVPQNYHVVKALCLLCTWPLPTKSTSTDATFMLAGLMTSIALQTGLHRPSHVQEFSRIRVELRDEDVQDRLKTWMACNIVLQTTSTGFGQPAHSVYDWTLLSLPEPNVHDESRLPTADLYWRLQVERFCDKISTTFYNNRTNEIGITSDSERAAHISFLVEEHRELARKMTGIATPIDSLHLDAAMLHLRLAAFFDSSDAPTYMQDLLELYFATGVFLNSLHNLPSLAIAQSSPRSSLAANNPQLQAYNYATSYLMQMTLACGFTLLKLLNSFFASHVDVQAARNRFNATVKAVRGTSVTNNDLPSRLAEVLAQLWRSHGTGLKLQSGVVDNSLQLKVRCRMSMSLIFDSVWRWREEFQFSKPVTEAVNLDRAVEQPTEVGEADVTESAALDLDGSATPSLGLGDATLPSLNSPTMMAVGTGALGSSFNDYNYEVFDPLTWMLDANLDFPGILDDSAFFN